MKRKVLFFMALPLLLFNCVAYGQSRGCNDFGYAQGHTNINCSQGDNWQNEKNGVVKIINNEGCWTGALLNTTLGDNNPHQYILVDIYAFGNTYDISRWEFYWHYESWACDCKTCSEPPRIKKTGAELGARVVAKNSYGKFALIEIDIDLAEEWDILPYYLGWDRSDKIEQGVTVIYHPYGDIKKIHSFRDALKTKTEQHTCNSLVYFLPVYWEIPYDPWETSPASSRSGSGGAPVFNSAHRLIGSYLWGGCANSGQICVNISLSKFSWAWEGFVDCNANSTNRLKDWLDPNNNGDVTLDGRGCQKTIRLQYRQPQLTDTYHAVQAIISKKGFDPKFNVTYKAGDSIVLKPGFHAKRGSIFHAQIKELVCGNAQSPSFSHQGGESHNDIVIENPDFSMSQSPISPKFNLLPNPNRGNFQIDANFPLTDIAHFKITNFMGATVYETQNVASNTVQLQNPAAGTFFVVMVLKDGAVLTRKMVVQ